MVPAPPPLHPRGTELSQEPEGGFSGGEAVPWKGAVGRAGPGVSTEETAKLRQSLSIH